MAFFPNKDLKTISVSALGKNFTLSGKNDYISAAQAKIDEKTSTIIQQKASEITNGINNAQNQANNVSANSNNLTQLSQPQNIQSAINPSSSGVMNQLQNIGTNNIPTTTQNIPSIPSVPSVSSAIPGGLSVDPTQYIPDLGGIPFKSFVKPLIDKALSKALSKFNPSSFVSSVQGSLGKIQEQSLSKLQGLQQQAQGNLEAQATQESEQLKQSVAGSTKDLNTFSKNVSKEAEQAKTTVALYVELYLLRIFDAAQFSTRMLDTPTANTFNAVDHAN